jgi:hypothetical protein
MTCARARSKALGRRGGPCYAFRVMRHLVCGLVLLALSGCGRNATREDCESIVDRNVEVQLRALGVTDSDLVEKRKNELRAAMKGDIETCVGKRVTDRMMACVRTAETADQIDKCLR